MRGLLISWFLQFVLSLFLLNCGSSKKYNTKKGHVKDNTMLGLIDDEGVQLVLQNCNSCHSTQFITQNRMTKAGWKSTIRWMQATQNLWDLGEDEALILTYLSENYAPSATGRRQSLVVEEWYTLE